MRASHHLVASAPGTDRHSPSEPLQAVLNLGRRIFARRIELGGDEHLVAWHAAFAERLPDAFLVAIDLGGVNVAVAEL